MNDTATRWVICILLAVSLTVPVILALYQRRTLRALLESNAHVAATAAAHAAGALAAIHTLVNSNLTEAQQRELSATQAMLASMREVISLKEDRGVEVAEETIEAVKAVERRIASLSKALTHKQEQTRRAADDEERRLET